MSYIEGLTETENMIEKPAPSFLPLVTHNLSDFLGLILPPRKMLLSPWLPEKGLAMIYAPRGIGKTFLGLSVAYAVAVGGEFLGFKVAEPRKVLYIDGEMAASELQIRTRHISAGFGKEPPEPGYFRMLAADIQERGLPDLATAEGLQAINVEVRDADLIVLDNLSTLIRSGKENDADAWGLVQDWILEQRRAGRSVILIHHANKMGGQRGTSKREDVLDAVLSLSLPEDYKDIDKARFNIHFTKACHFYGSDREPLEARYEVQDGKGLWSRSKIKTKVEIGLEGVSENLSLRQAAEALGLSKSTIQRHRSKQAKTTPALAKSWSMNPVPASQPLSRGTVGQSVTADLEKLIAEARGTKKPPEPGLPDAP
ncbi:MAG: AAA family ATPase [Alphaproteobacteria bacterium]|nr:AAA family ATPase [Alphaproteobacteria bacterium]